MSFLQESLKLCEEVGDRWGMGTALRNLGLAALDQKLYAVGGWSGTPLGSQGGSGSGNPLLDTVLAMINDPRSGGLQGLPFRGRERQMEVMDPGEVEDLLLRGHRGGIARRARSAVREERKVKHPLYGKVIRLSKKYHAHDEENACHEGDVVIIEESRPLSKTKSWKVVQVVEQAKVI